MRCCFRRSVSLSISTSVLALPGPRARYSTVLWTQTAVEHFQWTCLWIGGRSFGGLAEFLWTEKLLADFSVYAQCIRLIAQFLLSYDRERFWIALGKSTWYALDALLIWSLGWILFLQVTRSSALGWSLISDLSLMHKRGIRRNNSLLDGIGRCVYLYCERVPLLQILLSHFKVSTKSGI